MIPLSIGLLDSEMCGSSRSISGRMREVVWNSLLDPLPSSLTVFVTTLHEVDIFPELLLSK